MEKSKSHIAYINEAAQLFVAGNIKMAKEHLTGATCPWTLGLDPRRCIDSIVTILHLFVKEVSRLDITKKDAANDLACEVYNS